MTQETNENDSKPVLRYYNCTKCNTTHSIKLSRDLLKDKTRFPFPYIFLHSKEGTLNDLVTLLYVDADLQIRGAEIVELERSNIFSEELAVILAEKLTDKIMELEEENFELKKAIRCVDMECADEIRIVENDNSDEEPDDYDEELEDLEIFEEEITEKTPKSEKKTIFFASTIGPGEKKQKLVVNSITLISELKITIGNLYGLIPANFHLAHEGTTLDETLPISSFNIVNNDEILLIPSSTAG